jgi:hypothetical protein
MSLILVLSGLAAAGVGLAGYAVRLVRDAETILPDHTVVVEGLASPAAAEPEM